MKDLTNPPHFGGIDRTLGTSSALRNSGEISSHHGSSTVLLRNSTSEYSFLRGSAKLLCKIHSAHRMDSQQIPTPESEEPKPVHSEADGAPTAQNMLPEKQANIQYRVNWQDASDRRRRQEFVSEVPLGPLQVTTKSFHGTTLLESPPSSLPAIEFITGIEGDAPRVELPDESKDDSSDESDRSTRSIRFHDHPGRLTRTRSYSVSMSPPPVNEHATYLRPRTIREYAPVAFGDITITFASHTMIKINSKDLLEAIRGVIKYYPSDRFSGDTVEISHPYPILVHHLDELEDLQGQLGQEFDAMC